MSDPNSRNSSESLEERAKRIAKEILKINNLRTLYATLRSELGAIKRQYPEWIKDLEPLKPREDVLVKAFTEKILTAIRKELMSMQAIVAEGLREIGQHVVDESSAMSEQDKKIREAKVKTLKYYQGLVKGLTTAISIIERMRSEA